MAETTGGAMANASALLHFVEGAPPTSPPFKLTLTEEELRRHIYYDDRVLHLLERLDGALNPEAMEIERVSPQRTQEYQDALASAREAGNTASIQYYEQKLNGYSQTQYNELVADIEEKLIALFAHIEVQYRERAETLNDAVERNVYRQAISVVDQAIEDENTRRSTPPTGIVAPENRARTLEMLEEARSNGGGSRVWELEERLYGHSETRDGPWQPLPEVDELSDFWGLGEIPQEIDQANRTMQRYDQIFTEYRLLEEGSSVKEPEEVLQAIVWFFVLEFIAEIVSGGFILFARASRAGISAARGLSDNVASKVARMSSRYNSRSNNAKAHIHDVFDRRHQGPRTVNDQTGPQGQGTAARQADEAAQVCRRC